MTTDKNEKLLRLLATAMEGHGLLGARIDRMSEDCATALVADPDPVLAAIGEEAVNGWLERVALAEKHAELRWLVRCMCDSFFVRGGRDNTQLLDDIEALQAFIDVDA